MEELSIEEKLLCFSNNGIYPNIHVPIFWEWGSSFDSFNNSIGCIILDVPTTKSPKQQISISPNPTYDEMTLTADEIITEATLTNISGSIVLHVKPDSKQTTLSIAQLPVGLYFFNVRYGDQGQGRYVGKVLKE